MRARACREAEERVVGVERLAHVEEGYEPRAPGVKHLRRPARLSAPACGQDGTRPARQALLAREE